MGPKTFRNVILLVALCLGAFAYWEPLKPSDAEAKAAILSALMADSGEEVVSLKVEHSFTGRNLDDGSQTRLWPARATIMKGDKELPDHDFYLMKSTGRKAHWEAEINDPKEKHWENVGLFGINRFGV
jgi:hypothetical protein